MSNLIRIKLITFQQIYVYFDIFVK